MNIKTFASPSGREPYSKWYNDNDSTSKKAIDRILETLGNLDFISDNALPKNIIHVKNQSRTDPVRQTDRLYEIRINEIRIYFGIIDDEIILFTGGHKDHQKQDIVKAKSMYIEYFNSKKHPSLSGMHVK